MLGWVCCVQGWRESKWCSPRDKQHLVTRPRFLSYACNVYLNPLLAMMHYDSPSSWWLLANKIHIRTSTSRYYDWLSLQLTLHPCCKPCETTGIRLAQQKVLLVVGVRDYAVKIIIHGSTRNRSSQVLHLRPSPLRTASALCDIRFDKNISGWSWERCLSW